MKKALFNTTVFDAGLPKFVAGQHYDLTDEVCREIARGNATEVELPDPKPEPGKGKAKAEGRSTPIPSSTSEGAEAVTHKLVTAPARSRSRSPRRSSTRARTTPTTRRPRGSSRRHASTPRASCSALCTQTWDWFLDYGFAGSCSSCRCRRFKA